MNIQQAQRELTQARQHFAVACDFNESLEVKKMYLNQLVVAIENLSRATKEMVLCQRGLNIH